MDRPPWAPAYQAGQRTKPKRGCGPLAAFELRRDAEEFRMLVLEQNNTRGFNKAIEAAERIVESGRAK